ncbi:MAG: hypothetical protein RSA70_00900 [Clostridia bacterium]
MIYILFDGLCAFFACVGLVSLLYLIAVARATRGVYFCALISARNAKSTETAVRVVRLFCNCDIVALTNPSDAANALEIKYRPLVALTPVQLSDYFGKKLQHGGSNGQGVNKNRSNH